MAGIGVDIKEVLQELGVLATIVRSPTNLTEMIAYEIDNSSSRSFYREYALNVEFVYDTVIVAGDVLQFIGDSYMVAHKTADSFENSITEYTGVVYKSNFPSTALLLVPAQTQNPTTFEITQGWTIRKSAPFGLAYRSDFFTLLDQEVSLGRDLGIRLECIIPASYDAEILDRVQLSSTEFYRIQDIEKYKFPGLHVLTLVDDERPAYVVPTDPTITWGAIAGIASGVALSGTQLNATTTPAGTFVYTPASGTVLAVGTHTLSTTFTPTDWVTYNTATKTNTIVVT